MSKVIQFPVVYQARIAEDCCAHRDSWPGKGYETVGSLRWEFDTDVCVECGAFSISSAQHRDFQAWLIKQPRSCFRVESVRLTATSVATAAALARRFKKSRADVYRACLALHQTSTIKDGWEEPARDEDVAKAVAHLSLHPILYLRVDAWTKLLGVPVNVVVGMIIDSALKQYASGNGKFLGCLESYLCL